MNDGQIAALFIAFIVTWGLSVSASDAISDNFLVSKVKTKKDFLKKALLIVPVLGLIFAIIEKFISLPDE